MPVERDRELRGGGEQLAARLDPGGLDHDSDRLTPLTLGGGDGLLTVGRGTRVERPALAERLHGLADLRVHGTLEARPASEHDPVRDGLDAHRAGGLPPWPRAEGRGVHRAQRRTRRAR